MERETVERERETERKRGEEEGEKKAVKAILQSTGVVGLS